MDNQQATGAALASRENRFQTYVNDLRHCQERVQNLSSRVVQMRDTMSGPPPQPIETDKKIACDSAPGMHGQLKGELSNLGENLCHLENLVSELEEQV